ncbi:MAG: hypothetical protein ACOX8S_02530 [Christensenellales bacterium]
MDKKNEATKSKKIANTAPKFEAKENQSIDEFNYDSQNVASATELTGLTAFMPLDEDEADSLNEIYDIHLQPSDITDFMEPKVTEKKDDKNDTEEK